MNTNFGPNFIFRASSAKLAQKCVDRLKEKHASLHFYTDARDVEVLGGFSKAQLAGFRDECLALDAPARIANAEAVVHAGGR